MSVGVFFSVVGINIGWSASDSAGDPAVRLPDSAGLPHAHRGWRKFHGNQCIYAGRQSSHTDCYAAAGLHTVTSTDRHMCYLGPLSGSFS